MSNRRQPADTALIDQANAAGADAWHGIHAMADHMGNAVEHVAPGPLTKAIAVRLITHMHDRETHGQPTLCPHLSYTAPQPAFWVPYAPDLLRCHPCLTDAIEQIVGTEEDNRCDHCQTVTSTIHNDAMHLPPIVLMAPQRQAEAIPPVIVFYGLCPACQKVDIEARP